MILATQLRPIHNGFADSGLQQHWGLVARQFFAKPILAILRYVPAEFAQVDFGVIPSILLIGRARQSIRNCFAEDTPAIGVRDDADLGATRRQQDPEILGRQLLHGIGHTRGKLISHHSQAGVVIQPSRVEDDQLESRRGAADFAQQLFDIVKSCIANRIEIAAG
jgi:hypothetical protein